MSIQVLEMTRADYDEVRALWQGTEGLGLSAADEAEAIGLFLERNPSLSFVARNQGQVVGSALCGQDGRRGYLYHVAVAPDHRGRGLGRMLVDRCLDRLRAIGIPRCHLFVFRTNRAARDFWEHNGWWERSDLWMMSRDLESDATGDSGRLTC